MFTACAGGFCVAYKMCIRDSVYATRVASRMNITKSAIDTEIAVRRRNLEKKRKQAQRKQLYDSLRDTGDKINPDRPRFLRAAKAEEDILSVMLGWPDKLSVICTLVQENDFVTDFNRRVFITICEIAQQNPCADFRQNLIQFFNSEEIAHINSCLLYTSRCV